MDVLPAVLAPPVPQPLLTLPPRFEDVEKTVDEFSPDPAPRARELVSRSLPQSAAIPLPQAHETVPASAVPLLSAVACARSETMSCSDAASVDQARGARSESGADADAVSVRADSFEVDGGGRLPPFLTKLFNLVSERETDDIVHWTEDGDAFRIADPQRLCRDVLPRYFKHNKLGSFTQQLHTYGFTRKGGELRLDQMVFSREHFSAGAPSELHRIRRGLGTGRLEDGLEHEAPAEPAAVVERGDTEPTLTRLREQLGQSESALSAVEEAFSQHRCESEHTLAAIGEALVLRAPGLRLTIAEILSSALPPRPEVSSAAGELRGVAPAISTDMELQTAAPAEAARPGGMSKEGDSMPWPSSKPTLMDLTAAADLTATMQQRANEVARESDDRVSERSSGDSEEHSREGHDASNEHSDDRSGSDGGRRGSGSDGGRGGSDSGDREVTYPLEADDRCGSDGRDASDDHGSEEGEARDDRSDSAGRSSDKSAGRSSDKSGGSAAGSAGGASAGGGSATGSAGGASAGGASADSAGHGSSCSGGAVSSSNSAAAGSEVRSVGSSSAVGSAGGSSCSGGAVSSDSAGAGSSASGGGASATSAAASSSSAEPRSEPSDRSGSNVASVSLVPSCNS